MPELDHHPEPVSLHDCAVCEDRGIEVESREYCQACYRGKRRKNTDAFAEKLRGLPFTDALWIVAHANIKTEHAIAAAELALLKSKLLQAERELAEVRKDAWKPIDTAPKDGTEVFLWLPSPYNRIEKARWFDLWENWQLDDFPDDGDEYCGIGNALPSHWMPLPAPPAASVAQENKEQGNG
jgi:hypothetical protein